MKKCNRKKEYHMNVYVCVCAYKMLSVFLFSVVVVTVPQNFVFSKYFDTYIPTPLPFP